MGRLFTWGGRRNVIGFFAWLAVALIINILAFVPMVLREAWQKHTCGMKEIEWDDILRYGLAIILGSSIQGITLQYFLGL